MSERPIIFSGPMVRAILDGRKTQTRRVVKWPSWIREWEREKCAFLINTCSFVIKSNLASAYRTIVKLGPCDGIIGKFGCPYGVPGDRLWVRETWAATASNDPCAPSEINTDAGRPVLWFRADIGDEPSRGWRGRWRPSIHMPRWASRITLELKDVRVERLQDITPRDAKAEGDIERSGMPEYYERGSACHVDWFRQLWDSINAKRDYSWESNPWVWVLEFERVKP